MKERMEWMDRLDKSAEYVEKRQAAGWILIDEPTRTNSVWEVRKFGRTIYVLAEMDDWDGSITESKLKSKPRKS
jgi:hypothetical protein